ncbi:IPT/TIG domain-containing protein [Hymenobacter rubidus]|uniref:IPT/TIG domain-containing protein n=1 Tax=Hymenobacter rubidus TaxID=1441626 RepID=UPI00191D1368|nr:IPT/TIG domain-containing protein [Hymenobacter rubidus]
MGLALGAQAQQTAPAFFRTDAEALHAAAVSPLSAALFHSQPLTLDVAAMRAALATAPPETAASAVPLVLTLPLPDGSTGRFALREAPVMAPELAAQFPAIKTYAGVGLDDAAASVRLDMTPQAFHAQVLTGNSNSFYIDPVSKADSQHYLGFYRRHMNRAAAGATMSCGFVPTADEVKATVARLASAPASGAGALLTGAQLRSYRLALACTPEYAYTKGNTVLGVMAAEVTTVNRVVGVYEKELAVRLVLVANNSSLIFLKGIGTQPPTAYTDANGSNMLTQNVSNINAIIGSANYDIGHVVSTGGGGVAGLGVVCGSSKARGVTGSSNPVGDAFDIDYVAHEMGHQFGGNHPFNGNTSSCGSGNRNANTAWEPGSGSTIMAYAGICGSANDLQPHSDAVFHTGNYQEMQAYISSTSCATTTATGNTAPVVTGPASGKTLPISTPFKLTAAGTDADGDPLTYMWEEMDLGTAGAPTATQVAGTTPPLFRDFVPGTDPTRYFPRLTDLVNNTTVLGERLPTVTRTLSFRCSIRDNHVSSVGVIGGLDYSPLVSLSTTSTAGPFLVTAPNTALSWTGGTTQTVTWDVANTTAAPVSCALVNLRLSVDGGLTYPVLLAANVANSGTAAITVPNLNTALARVMVEAADNYFFDISNANFTIVPGTGPAITSFTPTGGPVGTTVVITGTNFTGATDVSINGTAATFTVTSATTISATVAAGTTSGLVSVTTPGGIAVSATPFVVGTPPTIASFTPTSGPTGTTTGSVGTTVIITGTNFTGATQVTFNGTAAPIYFVNSATQVTVLVPAGATTGPITVTTPSGTATSATNFTVPLVPVITSFTPTSGSPGTVVTITGANFTGATQVYFNGVLATVFTVSSANQITATVPTGTATGYITVVTPIGVGVSTSVFTYVAPPAATITSISPTSGPVGTVVTITGTNLSNATAVAVNGVNAVRFIVVNSTTITFSVPGGATSGFVTVTTAAGTVVGPIFTVILPPTVSSMTPTSGPAGTVVTITGTDLTGVTSITLNGVTITNFTVVNGTTITFTVPAGAATGNVVVTNAAGSSTGTLFTITTATAAARANGTEFSVWPNPVAGQSALHVTLASAAANASVSLRTVLGQTVATRTFSGTTTDLPTTNLAAGTYLLLVQMEGRAPSVQRVVVQ